MSESNTRAEIVEVMARAMTRFALRDALDEAEAALNALEASGRAVVPREPTEAMLLKGADTLPDYDPSCRDAEDCWHAMLAAALPPSKE